MVPALAVAMAAASSTGVAHWSTETVVVTIPAAMKAAQVAISLVLAATVCMVIDATALKSASS